MSRREIIAYAISHAPKGVKGGPYEGPLVIGRPVPTLAEAWRTHSRETLLWWLHVTRHTVPTARVIRIVRARLAASGPDPMPVVRAAMRRRDVDAAAQPDPGTLAHLRADLRDAVRERDELRHHYDAAAPEHNLLALLDSYESDADTARAQVESMALRIESLAEELAKPEDVRLRDVLDALDGRAVIFDGLGARVGHLLDEMDEWIGRAGEAERMVEAARRSLSSVAESMTEHAYQELASALEVDACRVGPREASAVEVLRELVAWWEAGPPTTLGDVLDRARAVLAASGPDPMPVVRAALRETEAEEAFSAAPHCGRRGEAAALDAAARARVDAVDAYREAGGK